MSVLLAPGGFLEITLDCPTARGGGDNMDNSAAVGNNTGVDNTTNLELSTIEMENNIYIVWNWYMIYWQKL